MHWNYVILISALENQVFSHSGSIQLLYGQFNSIGIKSLTFSKSFQLRLEKG